MPEFHLRCDAGALDMLAPLRSCWKWGFWRYALVPRGSVYTAWFEDPRGFEDPFRLIRGPVYVVSIGKALKDCVGEIHRVTAYQYEEAESLPWLGMLEWAGGIVVLIQADATEPENPAEALSEWLRTRLLSS